MFGWLKRKSKSGDYHKAAVDAYDAYWSSLNTKNFTYFKRIKMGMVSLILYAPDNAATFKKIHKRVFGDETKHGGPGLAVFRGLKQWSKKEFLLHGQLYIMVPVALVKNKIIVHENVLAHEMKHIMDWYSEMVDGPDYANPDLLNNNIFYK